jgi:hypothetical protein
MPKTTLWPWVNTALLLLVLVGGEGVVKLPARRSVWRNRERTCIPKVTRAVTGLAAAALAVGMAQSRARGHPSRQVAEFTLRQLQTGHVNPG